jgi:hypothetical protein
MYSQENVKRLGSQVKQVLLCFVIQFFAIQLWAKGIDAAHRHIDLDTAIRKISLIKHEVDIERLESALVVREAHVVNGEVNPGVPFVRRIEDWLSYRDRQERA